MLCVAVLLCPKCSYEELLGLFTFSKIVTVYFPASVHSTLLLNLSVLCSILYSMYIYAQHRVSG